MSLPLYRELQVHRFYDGSLFPERAMVSCEYLFSLKINGLHHASIACSSSDLEEMTLGYLLSDGIVASPASVRAISVDEGSLTISVEADVVSDPACRPGISVTTATGRARSDAPPQATRMPSARVPARAVLGRMNEFLVMSPIREITHGVHSSALCDARLERLAVFDEIGRHNAIDKAIGFAAKHDHSPGEMIILSTGRIAGEIVLKIVTAGVSAIISRASPTTRAIEIARAHGVTVIGRAHGDSFVVFNGVENVVL